MQKQEVSQEEFQRLAFQTALAKSIIANQWATNQNEILKHTPYYKANIKKYGKPLQLALIQAEKKEFDKVDNVDSKRVDEIFLSMDKIFETLSRAIFVDYEEVNDCIKALAKDRDSMVGIAKKILKNGK